MTTPTASETTTLNTSEKIALLGNIASTDISSLSLAESAGIEVIIPIEVVSSDVMLLEITETAVSDKTHRLSSTDAMKAGLTETSAVIIPVPVTSNETTALSVGESSSILPLSFFRQKKTNKFAASILRSNAVTWWPLDERIGNFKDNAGNNRTLTVVGTPIRHRTGYSSESTSVEFSGTQYGLTSIKNLFMHRREHMPFTFELKVKTPKPVDDRLLMGRGVEGLFVTPSGFRFTIRTTDGIHNAYYDVGDWTKAHHVAAIYGEGIIAVALNGHTGTMVSISGKMTNTTDNFYVGGTPNISNTTVRITNPAVYMRPLPAEVLLRHSRAQSGTMAQVASRGGKHYDFTDRNSIPAVKYIDVPGKLGINNDVEVIGNAFTVSSDADQPAVRYTDIINLMEEGVIDGSRVDFDASSAGVLVESSIDLGNTWLPVTNHSTIPGLGEGKDVADIVLQFRYTFTPGQIRPKLWSLRAVVYTSKNPASMQQEVANGFEPYTLSEKRHSFVDGQDNMGIRFGAGGYIEIPADTNEPIYQIEFWVKRQAATGYILDTRTAKVTNRGYIGIVNGAVEIGNWSGVFINGRPRIPTINDFPINEWVHVVLNLNSPTADRILVNNNVTKGLSGPAGYASLSLYSEPISSAKIEENFVSAYGRKVVAHLEDQKPSMKTSKAIGYNYPWGRESGGG